MLCLRENYYRLSGNCTYTEKMKITSKYMPDNYNTQHNRNIKGSDKTIDLSHTYINEVLQKPV